MNMIEKRMEARGQGGFTLIELLVVVAILAVLGGAAIIGIGQLRDNARQEVCNNSARTIQTAAEAYNVENNAYPADGDPVPTLVSADLLKEAPDTGTYTITAGEVAVATCA